MSKGPKFGGAKWRAGAGANHSRTTFLLRRAMTTATNKFGTHGIEKTREKPRKPSMPKMPWEEQKP